jgi:indole-3-glycerol phosphate synthase
LTQTILDSIIEETKKTIKKSKKQLSLSELERLAKPAERDFKAALKAKQLSLIAEIKKASPTAGLLRKDFDVKQIAKIYGQRAQAISVITNPCFQGKKEFLKEAKSACSLPVLRKDFVVDDYQLFESLVIGADAVLLIAAILSKKKLDIFFQTAKEIGLPCLVEVHSEKELESLPVEAEIIGINNRNLKTMKIDLNNFDCIETFVPEKALLVAESGYDSKQAIDSLRGKANAVLIGSALMKSQNIEQKILELGF